MRQVVPKLFMWMLHDIIKRNEPSCAKIVYVNVTCYSE
jgi:hypothetical protein